jgi:HEAT repeat protein
MLGTLLSVFLSTLFLVGDDPPKAGGKTAAQWQEILQKAGKPELRQRALLALSILGPKVQGVVPAVCAALKDADAAVRADAAQTLGQMAPEAKPAIESLTEALKSEKEGAVRQAEATALGRFGPAAKTAQDRLTESLKDKHAGTRGAAAEALGRIGPDAWTSVANLTPLLKDSDRLVRTYTAHALGRICRR